MPIPSHEGPLSPRAWTSLVLAGTLGLLGLVGVLNAIVDPTAQLGTGVLDPIAAGPRDRAAKATILADATSVPLVVLGSSRSKKLDPAWLGAPQGVNAAVVGGDLFEARVLASWLAKRSEESSGEPFPRLVVGVDVEQLRDSSLQGSGFLDVPLLAATARREAADAPESLLGELDRLNGLLLTWQVTKATAASVRARVRGTEPPAADAGGEAADREDFTTRGVPVDDAAWDDPATARQRARRTPAAVERNVDELRATYERHGSRLDEGAVADLRALVRIAHEAGGPAPLLYVTPGHPALDALDALGRADRHARVLALLRRVAHDGRGLVIDCARCVDDERTSWIDATHPSPLGMRQLAERLRARLDPEADQAPSATPTERSGASR